MNLRFHMIRDFSRNLCYVPTQPSKADPSTKPLVGSEHISVPKTVDHGEAADSDDGVQDYFQACRISVYLDTLLRCESIVSGGGS